MKEKVAIKVVMEVEVKKVAMKVKEVAGKMEVKKVVIKVKVKKVIIKVKKVEVEATDGVATEGKASPCMNHQLCNIKSWNLGLLTENMIICNVRILRLI